MEFSRNHFTGLFRLIRPVIAKAPIKAESRNFCPNAAHIRAVRKFGKKLYVSQNP
jgi:hypothetical protein